jgi:HlyD family secretion protein
LKKKLKKLIIGVIVLVVLVSLWGACFGKRSAQAVSWTTRKVDSGDIAVTITATGTVEPLSSIQVGSQISGKANAVLVDADQRVKKGQMLAVIDPELLEAERNDRQLALKLAQSNVALLAVERENLDVRERKTRVAIEREKVSLARAQATLALAAKNLQRYQDMLLTNATNQSDVDTRELDKDNAGRDVQAERLAIDTLDLELLQIVADRKSLAARCTQADLAVGQAQQALSKAETNLSYTSIVSPIDGVVLERAIDPGQTIAAQFQTPNLFKIVSDLSVVRIQAQIDEADIGRLRQGQKVTFEVDAFKGQEFSGAVKAVRLKSELRGNLVTYPVLIEAENPACSEFPNGKLRPGMTAYLTFEVEKKANVVRVPAAALRFAPGEGIAVDKTEVQTFEEAEKKAAEEGKKAKKANGERKGLPATVHLIGEQNKLKAIPVRVGESDSEYYELLWGTLKAGDDVVTQKKEDKPIVKVTSE